MFICKKCKNDKKCWCSLQSRGVCEMCGEDSVCVDHHCDIDMPNKQKEEQIEKCLQDEHDFSGVGYEEHYKYHFCIHCKARLIED